MENIDQSLESNQDHCEPTVNQPSRALPLRLFDPT